MRSNPISFCICCWFTLYFHFELIDHTCIPQYFQSFFFNLPFAYCSAKWKIFLLKRITIVVTRVVTIVVSGVLQLKFSGQKTNKKPTNVTLKEMKVVFSQIKENVLDAVLACVILCFV